MTARTSQRFQLPKACNETALEKEKIIDLLEKWKTIEITNFQKKISSKLQLITCDNKSEARDNDGPKHKSSSDIFSHMLSMWQALTGQALLKKRLVWWIEVFWSHEENPAAYQHIMHMLHLFIKLLTQELCKKKTQTKTTVILNSQLVLQQSCLFQTKEENPTHLT